MVAANEIENCWGMKYIIQLKVFYVFGESMISEFSNMTSDFSTNSAFDQKDDLAR